MLVSCIFWIQQTFLFIIMKSDIRFLYISSTLCNIISSIELMKTILLIPNSTLIQLKLLILGTLSNLIRILISKIQIKSLGSGDISLLGTLLILLPADRWVPYFWTLSGCCMVYALILKFILRIHHKTLIPFAPILCCSYWISR